MSRTAHDITDAFRFVDLFAGIGGFAAALTSFGGKGVYAVEIDKAAAEVYHRNWGHNPYGDVTLDATDEVMNVPSHEVLAAGFPCQPFSKSGAQRGMDETRGTLYWNILQIIGAKKPKVVLLENVRNLAGPRHMHEWEVIIETLRDEGYRVSETPAVFSPHYLPRDRGGRPQIRERVFITATHNPSRLDEDLPVYPVATPRARVDGFDPSEWDLATDLPLDEDQHVVGCDLSVAERHWIDAWDAWVQMYYELTDGRQPPGFPIWADEWVLNRDLIVSPDTPAWKANFLVKNADMYTRHRRAFDRWAKTWGVFTESFPASRRKFEWQAQDTPTLWECVMHFRPSGIRAKRPTYLPALVAITQTSIIGPRQRRLSPREAARLQGFPEGFDFGDQRDAQTYRQLGNSVNIGVVWHVMRQHVQRDSDILKQTAAGRRIISAVDGAPDSPDSLLRSRFPR
jgi:DNA (cytosine-5)-methyltransferase 1